MQKILTMGNNYIGNSKKILLRLPLYGTLLFALLYFIATLLYPGGSQVSSKSVGFSWINNYWCNLLNDPAIDGLHNPAKPVALVAMVILCITLSVFWFLFPKYAVTSHLLAFMIRVPGVLAMVIAFFLFANIDHDLITNLASAFGVIATAGTLVALYKIKWYGLLAFGLMNIALVGLNNYFYYTKDLITYLPLVQKITFATFLIWICCIDVKLYNKTKLITHRTVD